MRQFWPPNILLHWVQYFQYNWVDTFRHQLPRRRREWDNRPRNRLYGRHDDRQSSVRYVGRTLDHAKPLVLTTTSEGVIHIFQEGSLPQIVSGLLGMAWRPLAKLGVPWWMNAASKYQWNQPLFAVALSR